LVIAVSFEKIETDLAIDDFRHQLIALRIAVILCHARRDPVPGCVQLTQGKYAIKLRCDAQWIIDFPQSAYLLREEALAWQKTEWPIEFVEN
jgi:exopolyphosphatase / guanosine-5'-triphosphate,3'-diphosphate pyrophosphatase